MAFSCSTLPRAGPFKPCSMKRNVFAPRTHYLTRQHVTQAFSISGHGEKNGHAMLDNVLRVTISSMIASGMLYLSPPPAFADLQTISPQVVTQMARPLPKQMVEKGKVWTLLIGGAVVLFAATVAAENNPSWFPAIVRANQSMKESMKEIEENEKRAQREAELLKLRQEQYDAEQRQLSAVQQGMKQARTKVLSAGPSPDAAADTKPQPQPAAAAVAAVPALKSPPAAPPVASTIPPTLSVEDSPPHSSSSTPASSSAISSGPYVVVEEVAPDMGAVAWPASTGGEPAAVGADNNPSPTATTTVAVAASNGGGAAQATFPVNGTAAVAAPIATAGEEDVEALARLSRLQGFVSGTMAGSKGAMEAYKAQRQ